MSKRTAVFARVRRVLFVGSLVAAAPVVPAPGCGLPVAAATAGTPT